MPTLPTVRLLRRKPYLPARMPIPIRLHLCNAPSNSPARCADTDAALLAAYEKGDAEYLASLRATQEHQLQELTLQIRKDQWRDADWQVQALQQARLSAQNQLAYYTMLVQSFRNGNEILYET